MWIKRRLLSVHPFWKVNFEKHNSSFHLKLCFWPFWNQCFHVSSKKKVFEKPKTSKFSCKVSDSVQKSLKCLEIGENVGLVKGKLFKTDSFQLLFQHSLLRQKETFLEKVWKTSFPLQFFSFVTNLNENNYPWPVHPRTAKFYTFRNFFSLSSRESTGFKKVKNEVLGENSNYVFQSSLFKMDERLTDV